jgi:mediator of RNA polymerase II transcription subunit 6
VYILETRAAFEGRLKTMSGLEFVVAQEPAEMDPGTGTGVWVIRKQTRRKRQGQDDEITVHATYFVVGENIYMAPTVGDIIGNRLVRTLGQLADSITNNSSSQSLNR